jgi:hypothetical protein
MVKAIYPAFVSSSPPKGLECGPQRDSQTHKQDPPHGMIDRAWLTSALSRESLNGFFYGISQSPL